nr:lipovitellin - African clawed frog [Xenopus laevis]
KFQRPYKQQYKG